MDWSNVSKVATLFKAFCPCTTSAVHNEFSTHHSANVALIHTNHLSHHTQLAISIRLSGQFYRSSYILPLGFAWRPI